MQEAQASSERSPHRKIDVTSKPPVGGISVVTLIRTDTTLDHSQKAEKVWRETDPRGQTHNFRLATYSLVADLANNEWRGWGRGRGRGAGGRGGGERREGARNARMRKGTRPYKN